MESPMLEVRPSVERGHAHHGWLDSYHSFSFAQYHDPRHMGFGALRVINEDWIQPGRGFDPHGHRDMEIITYVLEGALAHRDSMGHSSIIHPGDVQRMSAGTGIIHSEYNASRQEPVHLLQIWIVPERRGLAPGYEQRHFPPAEKRGRLRLLASPDGRDGSVTIHQDAHLYAALLDGPERAVHRLTPGRRAYVHVARGRVAANGELLQAGDALKAREVDEIVLDRGEGAEVLVFDLA
jgi:redox-sensitive bicupin YhaK (pirin superfamily)